MAGQRQRKTPGLVFSRFIRGDFFEALPLLRPELAGKIPTVSRRRDRSHERKSKAGRPRYPTPVALARFLHDYRALTYFEAACDLRNAERVAGREGVSVRRVLLRSMDDAEADATEKLGRPVLRVAKWELLQPRRRTLTDTALKQALGLTARHSHREHPVPLSCPACKGLYVPVPDSARKT